MSAYANEGQREAPSPPTQAGPGPAILAIDPGRSKCGVAIVRRSGVVAVREVVDLSKLATHVNRFVASYNPVAIIVGSGTGSGALLASVREAASSIPVELVDESHTSEQARARFVAENPPRGWQVLLPRALRTPYRAYDDYVAVILAERWWANRADSNSSR